ncbi:MAG: heme oxygenase [Cyanobacteria bacterium RYN_339]|nr:heme oxygenase [Cyanobacteria bacterium RYN_339]
MGEPTMTLTNCMDLKASIEPIRDRLVRHPVYAAIKSIEHLRIFMEHHVFAVWDFMSLLKALQRDLTCVTLPWRPVGDALSRRLINEIVLGEETDIESPHTQGSYLSHFELYRAAMAQCGANTLPIDTFICLLDQGVPVQDALLRAGAPAAARAFVATTFETIHAGKTHGVAGAFTLGREDLIPDMFRSLVADLNAKFPGQLALLIDYLERHIQLDEEHHTPMAMSMLEVLCKDDPTKLREADQAIQAALRARVALWDGINSAFGTPQPAREVSAWTTQTLA